MSLLQKKINGRQVRGIVGEFSDDSPKTARQYIVYGEGTFGRLFYLTEKALDGSTSSEKSPVAIQGLPDDEGTYTLGILVNPKEHFTNGFVPSVEPGMYTLHSTTKGTSGTIATRGHIWVFAADKVTAGTPVYVNADGEIGSSSLEDGVAVTGATWLTSAAEGKLAEIAIDTPNATVEA